MTIEFHKETGIRGCKAVGKLAEILQNYEAPEDTRVGLARRIGAIVGRGIPYEKVDEVIVDSLNYKGVPDWGQVLARLGEAARNVYKGKSPF